MTLQETAYESNTTKPATPVGKKKRINHGMSRTPEYSVWKDIKKRTQKKDHKDYPRYGGRGINLHEDWAEDFMGFYKEVGPRPSDKHSIDRDDNDLGYIPNNLSWKTKKQQQNNMRTNKFLTFEGQTLTIAQWSRRLPLTSRAIEGRLDSGWSDERTLTTPLNIRKRDKSTRSFRGKRKTVSAHAKDHGLLADTVKWRLKQGWSANEALLTPPHGRKRWR